MSDDFFNSPPLVLISGQKAFDKVYRFGWESHVVGNGVGAREYRAANIVGIPRECVRSNQHRVEHHSHWPHVHLWTGVGMPANNFGWRI